MADTLRSISVLLAAAIACTVKAVSPAIADETAAIIVSIIILVSIGPLIMGLAATWRKIIELKRTNHDAGKDYTMSTLPWMEEFQHLPSPVKP